MWFTSYLPFLIVGIAVVAFLIKLFVSLSVVSKAPDWQTLADPAPGATKTDRADAGIHTEQILLDAKVVPDYRLVDQPYPEHPGEQAHLAGEVGR
jgi:hypothetical protein